MYKYFKKWFDNVVVQGQQLVGNSVFPNRGSTENERTRTNSTERVELPRETKVQKVIEIIERPKGECRGEKNKKNKRRSVSPCAGQRRKIDSGKKIEEIAEHKGEEKQETNCRLSASACQCENCSLTLSFNECGVCLESLQNRGIRSCPVCANIVCSKCTQKVTICPYCRSTKTLQKNRAMERLLNGFFMPCKNARNGCRKMLNGEMRADHEAICEHASLSCPVSKSCCWNGSSEAIMSHLQQVHKLKPVKDDHLTVEITNFREKTSNNEGDYGIYVSCHGQLFAIKIRLRGHELLLSCVQLGAMSAPSQKRREKQYNVGLKIKAAGRSLRGRLYFGKFNHETRQISINCTTLCPEKSRSYNDTITIEMSVREMEADKNEHSYKIG